MVLQNWLHNGWLIEHNTSAQEISDLFAAAESDILNAQVQGLTVDWRMSIAYTAALRVANAALAASGYRVGHASHHYYLIQTLEYTIGLDTDRIRQFEAFRKKRNISNYDRTGSVSQGEADEMLTLAKYLQRITTDWLRVKRPDLLEG